MSTRDVECIRNRGAGEIAIAQWSTYICEKRIIMKQRAREREKRNEIHEQLYYGNLRWNSLKYCGWNQSKSVCNSPPWAIHLNNSKRSYRLVISTSKIFRCQYIVQHKFPLEAPMARCLFNASAAYENFIQQFQFFSQLSFYRFFDNRGCQTIGTNFYRRWFLFYFF